MFEWTTAQSRCPPKAESSAHCLCLTTSRSHCPLPSQGPAAGLQSTPLLRIPAPATGFQRPSSCESDCQYGWPEPGVHSPAKEHISFGTLWRRRCYRKEHPCPRLAKCCATEKQKHLYLLRRLISHASPACTALAWRCPVRTLRQALDDYLALRRGLGFKLQGDGVRLRSFLCFLEEGTLPTSPRGLAADGRYGRQGAQPGKTLANGAKLCHSTWQRLIQDRCATSQSHPRESDTSSSLYLQ